MNNYYDTPEIRRRISIARNATVFLTKIWKDKGISLTTKWRLLTSFVFSIASYGAECWALTESDKKKIESFELWCLRRVLRISWTLTTTNAELLRKFKPKTRLLDVILQRKLRFTRHIIRDNK